MMATATQVIDGDVDGKRSCINSIVKYCTIQYNFIDSVH